MVRSPSEVVVKALRDWIEGGEFREGHALPSERELAQRLGVARATVRAAFGELQGQGLIEQSSQRRRRVVRREVSQTNVLGRTAAILTEFGRISGNFSSVPRGWDLFTYQKCIQALQEKGYHALLMAPSTLEGEHLVQVLAGRPLGILLTSEVPPGLRERLIVSSRAYRVPLVADGDAPDVQEFDRVGSDHALGCEKLTEACLAAGRSRVVCFWPHLEACPYWLSQRRAGYERAMRRAGLTPLPVAEYPLLPEVPAEREAGSAIFLQHVRTLAGHLLPLLSGEHPVQAVLCITGSQALLTTAALRLAGRIPGRDVWVAGYDNTWEGSAEALFEVEPPTLTIDKHNERVGEALAEMLMERQRVGLEAPPMCRLLEPELLWSGRVAESRLAPPKTRKTP